MSEPLVSSLYCVCWCYLLWEYIVLFISRLIIKSWSLQPISFWSYANCRRTLGSSISLFCVCSVLYFCPQVIKLGSSLGWKHAIDEQWRHYVRMMLQSNYLTSWEKCCGMSLGVSHPISPRWVAERARFVAKGYMQTFRIDSFETFSLMVCLNSVRFNSTILFFSVLLTEGHILFFFFRIYIVIFCFVLN